LAATITRPLVGSALVRRARGVAGEACNGLLGFNDPTIRLTTAERLT
jgi:hypothetical protein